MVLLKKSIYESILKDEGNFSSIDSQKRIMVAENTYDLGEYLGQLYNAGELKMTFGPVSNQWSIIPLAT